jgi:thioredoxin-related protein
MKYVVVDREGKEELYIFPCHINHDSFAEILSYIKTGGRNWRREFAKPISAGFTDGGTCNGRSETLGLSSRPIEDTALLRKLK